MMQKAGERLFEAIGQIPEEIILEAENDRLTKEVEETADSGLMTETAKSSPRKEGEETENGGTRKEDEETAKGSPRKEIEEEENTRPAEKNEEKVPLEAEIERKGGVPGKKSGRAGDLPRRKQKWSRKIGQIGGYLKYLPVAACLCIVCSGMFFIVRNYGNKDKSAQFSMFDSTESGGQQQTQESAVNGGMDAEDTKKNEAFDDANVNSSESGMSGGGMTDQLSMLPVRNDAYEGPVLSMTATGDTHNVKTKRWLKSTIDTEEYKDLLQPRLSVRDTYEIQNNSKEDKTLQLVYPFVTTLNLADDLDGEVIQIAGQDEKEVSYNIGDSVWTYFGQDFTERSAVGDYVAFLKNAQDYQEHALEKEADWSRQVSVYTFTDIHVQDVSDGAAYQRAAGVKIKGTGADVLTYGFDHSFETEEGVSNYCFFIPQEPRQIMMIVTGEPDEEPELGFYANLDCEEPVDGITCNMKKEEMSYADALRLCSRTAFRQAQQDYETGVYEGRLPVYFNDDAVFKALTAAGDEDTFYAHITERCHTAELEEIFEQLLGEVRIVYAMTMVTIPAGQSVRVEALTQKCQYNGHYKLLEENKQLAGRREYQFDFLIDGDSRLNIEKTIMKIGLPSEWKITDENMKLKKQGTAYRAVLKEKTYHMSIKQQKQE